MTSNSFGGGFAGPDADGFEYEDIDVKEALGLPDALPPVRLPSLAELAARAREAPMARQLAALAAWVGEDGQPVTEDGELTSEGAAAAAAVLGVSADDLGYLWAYAVAVEWVAFDAGGDDRAVPGETADDWASGDDEPVFEAWSSTLAAVLSETLIVSGPPDPDDPPEAVAGLEFDGQPMVLAILLFLSRREGLSPADFSEVLWENAAGELPGPQAVGARASWLARYGDPARLLLDRLAALRAVTEAGGAVRLTPLALAALREQLVDAGVDIPLLPPTAAELTGAQLIAMAEGVGDDEFEAEADAWVAARGAGDAARELLGLAARGGPGERMLAVAAVTRIGAPAGPAWRDSLDVPEIRGYAKVALATLGDAGEAPPDLPPGLRPLPEDLAWLATDMLALACDDEFPDPDDLVVSFREAVPPGQEAALFEAMWRGSHPDVVTVLNHVGRYHPDQRIAKAARAAAHKAASRRAAASPQ